MIVTLLTCEKWLKSGWLCYLRINFRVVYMKICLVFMKSLWSDRSAPNIWKLSPSFSKIRENGTQTIRQICGIPYGVKIYILMHLDACIKLMHLLRIEFQMYGMNRLFAYIMVRNLDFNFINTSNQSEDRNRSGMKRKDGSQSQWRKRSRSTMKSWYVSYW